MAKLREVNRFFQNADWSKILPCWLKAKMAASIFSILFADVAGK
jgi:hypothetical protein